MPATGVWNFILWLHYLALSLWMGGITFLSAIAAPSTHGSVASRAIAGEIVGRMLKRFNTMELTCALLLLVTSISSFRFVMRKESLWILIVAILVMGVFTSFYTFHLTPQMDSIKEKNPTLSTLSKDHPAKVEFDKLHHLYVRLMSLNLVIGIAALYGSVVILK